MVQGDVDRSVRARREPGDHPRPPVGQGREAMIDVGDHVEDVVLKLAGAGVGPFGVRVGAPADSPVREYQDHRPQVTSAELVVEPDVHVRDVDEHLRAARHAVEQIEDRVALGRVVAGGQIREVIRSAVKRGRVEVDVQQPSLAGARQQGEADESSVLGVRLHIAVGAEQTADDHRQRDNADQRASPCDRAHGPKRPSIRGCGRWTAGIERCRERPSACRARAGGLMYPSA